MTNREQDLICKRLYQLCRRRAFWRLVREAATCDDDIRDAQEVVRESTHDISMIESLCIDLKVPNKKRYDAYNTGEQDGKELYSQRS